MFRFYKDSIKRNYSAYNKTYELTSENIASAVTPWVGKILRRTDPSSEVLPLIWASIYHLASSERYGHLVIFLPIKRIRNDRE